MNFTIPRRPAVFMLTRAVVSTGLFCAATSVVFGQMQSSTNRSTAFGPDACGPADPAYIHAANETGGIPMFLQRSEAAKAFHLVRESTRNNVATVFWATGTWRLPAQVDIGWRPRRRVIFISSQSSL